MLKDETLARKLISKWFWLYLFSFVIAPSGYIIRVFLSNDLEVSEVWIIYSIISIFSLLIIFNDFWFKQGFNRFLPKYWIDWDYNQLKTIIILWFVVKLITTLIVWVVFFMFSWLLAENYFQNPQAEQVLNIFIFYFLFLNILSLFRSIFKSFQNAFASDFVHFLEMYSIVTFVVILFLSWTGSIETYSFAWLFGKIFATIIGAWIFFACYRQNINFWKFQRDTDKFKNFFYFSIFALLGGYALKIINKIDLQMVMLFLGPEQAGFYTNFVSLLTLLTFFLSPLLGFVFPIVSELASKQQYEKISLLQEFLYKYFITFAFSISVLLAILWPTIAAVLFSDSYVTSWLILMYVALFGVFKIMFNINFGILMWLGHSWQRTLILVFVLIFNIILNLILIPTIWVIWAGLATGLSWMLIAIASFRLLNRNIDIKIDWLFYLKNLIIIWILGGLLFYYKDMIFVLDDVYRFQNLAYIIIIGISYYLILAGFNINQLKYFYKQLQKFKKNKI